MSDWDYSTDFLVVGSGGGGMTGAITAHDRSAAVLILEKTDRYGGSTTLSGGVIWVPNNHLMKAAGIEDSEAEAWEYLHAVTAGEVCERRLRSYIRYAPEMVQTLETQGDVRYGAATTYMDYYPELPGAKRGGRSLDPEPFSARRLRGLADLQRRSKQGDVLRFSVTAREGRALVNFNWKSWLFLIKRLVLFYLDIPSRLQGRPDNRMTLGRSLGGQLRYAVMRRNIPLWLNTRLLELVVSDGAVTGAVVEKEGTKMRLQARKGVLLAAGGFDHNQQMREQYHPDSWRPGWSAGNPANTGDAILAGQAVGAAVEFMHCAWWTPTYKMPDGRADALIAGKSMPGSIFVNQAGQRFTNEAAPYEDVTKGQFEAHSGSAASVPCYMVFDATYRRKYPIGPIGPAKAMPDEMIPADLKRMNFLRRAATLRELAEQLGIDADGLEATVARVNGFAASGRDLDFGRGDSLHDRYYSDPAVSPNPNLAALAQGPFYAIEILAGDLGTKGGLKADAWGRVLDQQDQTITGLYAAGNCSGSVMGNSYPGAGSTIGPAMTFAWLAARHATGDALQ
ncbi:MAG: FAD-binding protein [Gammaproteobacteria bacterium]|nr:FAD-binding protein [Gammaproteobacteria bacterium]